MTSKKTALVYSSCYEEHKTGPEHPERPERVRYVYQFLKKAYGFFTDTVRKIAR